MPNDTVVSTQQELLMTEPYACSHVNSEWPHTQGKGVGTFYTLGGSCNLNSRLCNLVPRALPNINTERKALSCVVMSCVVMSCVMSCVVMSSVVMSCGDVICSDVMQSAVTPHVSPFCLYN